MSRRRRAVVWLLPAGEITSYPWGGVLSESLRPTTGHGITSTLSVWSVPHGLSQDGAVSLVVLKLFTWVVMNDP